MEKDWLSHIPWKRKQHEHPLGKGSNSLEKEKPIGKWLLNSLDKENPLEKGWQILGKGQTLEKGEYKFLYIVLVSPCTNPVGCKKQFCC